MSSLQKTGKEVVGDMPRPTIYRYRYVNYGTRFTPKQMTRAEADWDNPDWLQANELAVDVGEGFWELDGCECPIIDHHFYRPKGQFPSAAAAVLHSAHRIRDRFAGKFSDVWLVTHQQPDFDAFCSMYLARCILEGSLPADGWERYGLHSDGWLEVGLAGHDGRQAAWKIDWYEPRVAELPADRKWAVLLASYAAHVDNCRKLRCPKHRTLHAVLYAALARGRDFQATGAFEFFNEVRLVMEQEGLNPLCDSVLENSTLFQPELSLLDREVEAYERDMAKARRALVNVPYVDFAEWYPVVAKEPLLSDDLTVRPIHLSVPCRWFMQVDGIYIRDPECLLFKEWARADVEHSSQGEGFLFTAIAYSEQLVAAPINKSQYFFALDPDRAGNAHLYNVWCRLQAEEAKALGGGAGQHPAAASHKPRVGYVERATGHEFAFVDPWFDGVNYRGTLVVTPNHGTSIGLAGVRGDLTDDPVAHLVQQELEFSIYDGPVTVMDYGAKLGTEPFRTSSIKVAGILDPQLEAKSGYYRFGSVPLKKDVDLFNETVARQIGCALWQVLHPEAAGGVPTDFASRHLICRAQYVAVWSRQGIVIAFHPQGEHTIAAVRELFARTAKYARQLDELIEYLNQKVTSEALVCTCNELRGGLLDLMHALTLPENRPLGRFFEATRLGELLEAVSDLHLEEIAKQQAERTNRLQNTLQCIALLVGAPALILAFFDAIDSPIKSEWWKVLAITVAGAVLLGAVGVSIFRAFHRRGPKQ